MSISFSRWSILSIKFFITLASASGKAEWAHSALPDAEANVIKNLMDRIDHLENEILKLQKTLQCISNSESIDISKLGDAQNS